MTLEKYIKELQNYAKKNPQMLKKKVIASKDNSGNGFFEVEFSPTSGVFIPYTEGNKNGDFHMLGNLKENGLKKKDFNATCIN